jgi:hypothetical protein
MSDLVSARASGLRFQRGSQRRGDVLDLLSEWGHNVSYSVQFILQALALLYWSGESQRKER